MIYAYAIDSVERGTNLPTHRLQGLLMKIDVSVRNPHNPKMTLSSVVPLLLMLGNVLVFGANVLIVPGFTGTVIEKRIDQTLYRSLPPVSILKFVW